MLTYCTNEQAQEAIAAGYAVLNHAKAVINAAETLRNYYKFVREQGDDGNGAEVREAIRRSAMLSGVTEEHFTLMARAIHNEHTAAVEGRIDIARLTNLDTSPEHIPSEYEYRCWYCVKGQRHTENLHRNDLGMR